MVAMPIIVLFFQEHGLSLTQVMLLQAIYSLSVAILEIPSGYIADIFGRKKTIILSTIFTFIGGLKSSFKINILSSNPSNEKTGSCDKITDEINKNDIINFLIIY